MNIFAVDKDPKKAARDLCDKHIVKMPLESAQMLSTTYHVFGCGSLYRPVHKNHKCVVWTRVSRDNFEWHLEHALELCLEYTRRYGRRHASQDVVEWCARYHTALTIPKGPLTPFALAMPQDVALALGSDPVLAYRCYYVLYKRDFARWVRSDPPSWWPLT